MIALGADQGGCELKESIKAYLRETGMAYEDFGVAPGEADDYPLVAARACKAVTGGQCEKALLFCGTGVGISIAANKIPGIRAACCSDSFSARHARLHNNANVLCLGGRVIGPGLALELVGIFLSASFEDGGRHAKRVGQIGRLEQERPVLPEK